MYKTILVPFDGSPLSARALPIAAALAQRSGARIHLAIVHDPSAYIPFVPGEVSIPVYDAELVQLHRAQDEERLQNAVATVEQLGATATGVLLEGTVVEALSEYEQSARIDLTVMTTHGRSGFERLRLGSVAASYLTRATAPLFLVRGHDDDTEAPLPVGPLLCPIDGSPFAESILPHARAFAEASDMSMALLSVAVPHPMPLAPFGTEALLADDSALQQEEKSRVEYLERICRDCPPGTTTHAVTDMSVSRAIVEEAARISAGALAMSTHGRGGLKRLMLGSVADEVIRHSHVHVLVYRPI